MGIFVGCIYVVERGGVRDVIASLRKVGKLNHGSFSGATLLAGGETFHSIVQKDGINAIVNGHSLVLSGASYT